MNKTMRLPILTTVLVCLAAQMTQAKVFFSDAFSGGSTINSGTPADPTSTSTAYQMLSTKTQTPAPAIAPGDLLFGIPSTSSGVMEIQALFATNPMALVMPGDNIQLTIVFTNTSGIFPASPGSSQLGIGLFNSGNIVPFTPLPGGTNVTTRLTITDYAEKWQGYFGQIVSGTSKILTRPSQASATDGWNQELVLSGSSSSTARNQATIASSASTPVSLNTGEAYTEVLSITMNDVNSLAITNTLYSGIGTGGTVVVSYGGIAANSTFLTGGFNGFGFGYQSKVAGSASTIDVSSIEVSGSITPVSSPPAINQQPVDVTVPNGASCFFSVDATGYNVTYQWHRYGTNLVDGGNISGANSSQLIISPAGSGDVASGANGYSVTINGAGGYSTNSEIHSLSLGTAKNLIYSGSGAWDLNNSASWLNTSLTPGFTFNFGDAVTFDDNGGGGIVNLVGSYLSASSVTINHTSSFYTFQGSGSFAGPGSLIYKGNGLLTINNANTYTGGTIISNAAANLRLGNLGGLGTGPVTLAKAGGKMEIMTAGGAASGIEGDVVVQDDFTIKFDGTGSYAGVFLGNLTGNAGKTLTLDQPDTTTTNRYRVYGGNTVYNGNLVLNGASTAQAVYNGTVLAPYSSGTQIYNGVISGNGGLVQRGGTTILAGANTYSGGTVPTTGTIGFGCDTIGNVTSGPIGTGALLLSPEQPSTTGSGTVLAYDGARTIANPLQYPSATNNLTLIIGGTNQLTFSGSIALQGQDGLGTQTNRIFQVANTAPTIFSGVVSGSGFGFTKTGAGALYLNNANTYTGSTTNSAGLLAGSGSLVGSVVVNTNASIGGGSAAAIGTFTIGGNLTLAQGGGGFFRLNKGNAQTADKVAVSGSLSSSGTGTITVTNLGSALNVGDTFTLFNQAVSGGSTLTVTGGGVTWTNLLGSNGTIQVIPSMATYSTNITYGVTNNILTISWPATHQGWVLQAQTNSLNAGLGTNWVTIPGTSSVITTNLTINPANPSVFYRLSTPN